MTAYQEQAIRLVSGIVSGYSLLMTMTGAIMSNRSTARRFAAGATVFAPLSLLSLDLTRGCRVR